MRILAMLSVVLAAACSPQGASNTASMTADNAPNLHAMAADHGPAEAGNEPATSASAQQAKALVTQYYVLIADKKYAEARKLWDNDGAASGGDVKAFAASFEPYSEYRPTVGAPTQIKASDGRQHVNVAVDLHVKNRANGASVDRSGTVMLRRALEPRGTLDQRAWRIWGVDIRKRD